MGQTLTLLGEWTTANVAGRGKFELISPNIEILKQIIEFVETFPVKHPEEADVVFKHPLIWETQLTPQELSEFKREDGTIAAYVGEGKDQYPIFELVKDTHEYKIKAYTFEKLAYVLTRVKSKAVETTKCLEVNFDPVARIIGEGHATIPKEEDEAFIRFWENIIVEETLSQSGTASQSSNVFNRKRLRLLYILQQMDISLLKVALQSFSQRKKMTIDIMHRDIQILQALCGKDNSKYCLRYLKYSPEFYPTPPPLWKQIQGEVCLLRAKPFDRKVVFVFCTLKGVYLIKGYSKRQRQMDFESVGEICPDVTTLFSRISQVFMDNIMNMDFTFHSSIIEARSKEEEEKKSIDFKESRKDKDKRDAKVTDQPQRRFVKKPKKLEPTMKWKTLGLQIDYKLDEQDGIKIQPRMRPTITSTVLTSRTKTSKTYESDSDSDSEVSEEDLLVARRPDFTELPPEYWQIQKLVKFIKVGTQTVTIIALCSIRDMNLSLETSQMAIEDAGGLELLVNLMNTEDNRCRIASLSILKEITVNFKLQRAVTNLGGIKCLVELLYSPNEQLRTLAADTIANVCAFSHARTLVRKFGGLHRLITLLEIDDKLLNRENLTAEQDLYIEIVRSGASALWTCTRSVRNRNIIFHTGVIRLLAKLLKSVHQKMVIPVIGTIQECSSDVEFREAVLKVGMIPDIVYHLKSENPELQKLCSNAIFKCAVNEDTRSLVRQNNGLQPLVNLLKDPSTNLNKELLRAVVGAIWKCSICIDNVIQFEQMKVLERLVELLRVEQSQEVVINIVGALAELNKDPPNREVMRKVNGIPLLIELLTVTNPALLINVSQAIGECAKDKENMSIIDSLDGVRLIWSLLKHKKTSVQAAAAWAICPCVENARESGEMVRSFVGGLELIISLLKSQDKEVLASICAAVAKIAMDEENLAVISDHGVVPMLAKLADTTDDKLRQNLAEAIACCSKWSKNGLEFAKSNTVSFLVSYLSSKDPEVHRSTTQALFELSRHPENCITMHEKGAVRYLITLVGSEDIDVQEWAAGSLKNIRSLAMANEKALFP